MRADRAQHICLHHLPVRDHLQLPDNSGCRCPSFLLLLLHFFTKKVTQSSTTWRRTLSFLVCPVCPILMQSSSLLLVQVLREWADFTASNSVIISIMISSFLISHHQLVATPALLPRLLSSSVCACSIACRAFILLQSQASKRPKAQ